ncbi:MAG: phosphatidate cytidylyltransferase [Pseudomonadales bacterium]|nr:phosphatidate cytidylyltransferase [Pseudomonadales bacterium]MCP5214221.1 phosphatidate cytidylyltransferase [Pseudomonadales bacterium]MCP5302585.1 phosphatidate cytidylyltransferase [Pseudomonadales bacterium]
MLKQRIITALILAPLVIAGIIYLSPKMFSVAALVVILLGAWEWAGLSGFSNYKKIVYLVLVTVGCFLIAEFNHQMQLWVLYVAVPIWLLIGYWVVGYPDSAVYWASSLRRALLGIAILLPAWTSLTLLKQMRMDGLLILLLMLIIWGADIGAYFSGRAWGGKKLAFRVSPGKTWAGAYGGLLSALMACWLFATVFGVMQSERLTDWLWFALLAFITATVSIVGDLTESMVKRQQGVKDSGALLPGHGGIMDRIDSLVAGLPFYTLLMIQIG